MRRTTRYGYLLGAALLTFGAGAGATLLRPSSARPFSPGEVQVRLKRSFRSVGGVKAEFEVVNRSAHPLRYRGYGRDSNEYWRRKSGDKVERFSPFCGNGLAERTLWPGGAATFEVLVKDAGPTRFGFDFLAGEARRRQTIRSDEVFIKEPLSADGN
jgi:hypothetical protein